MNKILILNMILHKAGNRTVISCLTLFGKKAGRKLFHPKVIAKTLTANPFPLAGFISAVAVLEIFFFVRTLHHFPHLLKILWMTKRTGLGKIFQQSPEIFLKSFFDGFFRRNNPRLCPSHPGIFQLRACGNQTQKHLFSFPFF